MTFWQCWMFNFFTRKKSVMPEESQYFIFIMKLVSKFTSTFLHIVKVKIIRVLKIKGSVFPNIPQSTVQFAHEKFLIRNQPWENSPISSRLISYPEELVDFWLRFLASQKNFRQFSWRYGPYSAVWVEEWLLWIFLNSFVVYNYEKYLLIYVQKRTHLKCRNENVMHNDIISEQKLKFV